MFENDEYATVWIPKVTDEHMKSILIRSAVSKRVCPSLCIVFTAHMLHSLKNGFHRSSCRAVVLSVMIPRDEELRGPIFYSSLWIPDRRWHHRRLSERVWSCTFASLPSVRLRSLWSLLPILIFLSMEITRISRSVTESDERIVIASVLTLIDTDGI